MEKQISCVIPKIAAKQYPNAEKLYNVINNINGFIISTFTHQLVITRSKLTVETREQGVTYVQS